MAEEKDYQHEFFDTAGVDDFKIKNIGEPPAGYPTAPVPDSYSQNPFDTSYGNRKRRFLEHCVANPSGTHIKGFYYELARLHLNKGPMYEGLLQGVLDYINDRYDCSDFVLLGMVRILYQFFDSTLLSERFKTHLIQTLLDFKYHPEEPGIDSMCYWTENHQIMFAANAYLAGQYFPDRRFTNSGQTGEEKMARSKSRIMKWLEMRFLTGFSEWLSHVYYDEDITALLNLSDFCEDPEIVTLSNMVLDLIFFDMAVNSRQGVFGCSHGRSYAEEKRDALVEATIDTQKLLFGTGIFTGKDLLYHFPRDYIDFSHFTTISSAPFEENISLKVKVLNFNNIYSRRGKNVQIAKVKDNTDTLTLFWLNQSYLSQTITPGTILNIAGQISIYKGQKTIFFPKRRWRLRVSYFFSIELVW